MSGEYRQAFDSSIDNREDFWLAAASGVDWDTPPTTAFDGSQWFPGARLNTCVNALDRHVDAGHVTER